MTKNLKSLLISTTALSTLFAAPAFAQTPVFNWSGFYIGINGGTVQSSASVRDRDGWIGATGETHDLDSNSIIGGVQGGYNWQSENFVLGGEVDWDFADVSDHKEFNSGTTRAIADLSELATIRARAGYAFDQILLYGTGGWAFANLTNEVHDTNFPFTVGRESSASGWTAGGGLEYAVDQQFTVRGEYLYADFGDKSDTFAGGPYRFDFKNTVSQFRAGINYRF